MVFQVKKESQDKTTGLEKRVRAHLTAECACVKQTRALSSFTSQWLHSNQNKQRFEFVQMFIATLRHAKKKIRCVQHLFGRLFERVRYATGGRLNLRKRATDIGIRIVGFPRYLSNAKLYLASWGRTHLHSSCQEPMVMFNVAVTQHAGFTIKICNSPIYLYSILLELLVRLVQQNYF